MPERLRSDLSAAFRQIRRRPALTATVTLTLALVIAAATTAVGLASAVLWRPLPFADAGRLVLVWEAVGEGPSRAPARVTGFRSAAWRDASADVLASTALFGAAGHTLDTPQGAISVRGVRVSAGYFRTLGIGAAFGRTFAPDDERPGNDRVVVLADGFWREHFGARTDLVGRTIRLSGRPFTVIGVMPPAVYPGWPVNPATVTLDPRQTQFWVPIARTPELEQATRAHVFGVLARLMPGITASHAADVLTRTTDPSAPDAHGTVVVPLREQFVRDARAPLLALTGAVLAILFIACANLAALYVSSFEARRAEFATRAALGATPARLIRQVSVEALLLAGAGGLVGMALACAALVRIPSLLPPGVPLLTPPVLDLRIALAGVAFTALAGLTMNAWPIVRLAAGSTAPRGVPPRAGRSVYRRLVMTQIAIATALVAVAALLAQSLQSVRARELGFDVARLFVADTGLPFSFPADPRRLALMEQRLLDAVARAPGVLSAAAAYDHPLEANWSENPVVAGSASLPDDQRQAELRIVSPGYFETVGVAVLEGRAFAPDDDFDAPGVAVVNEAFARELDGPAIGRRIRTRTPQVQFESAPSEFEIVGVVANERFRGLEAPVLPAFYLSTRQFPQTSVSILARTAGDPLRAAGTIRGVVRGVDRAITFDDPTALERILAEQLVARRATTTVIGGVAAAALALAALGLYGLLGVLVGSRTRESGVRLALGASPARLAAGVVRESVTSTVAGLAVGVLLAAAAGRLVQGLLVGVTFADARTLGATACVLVAVAVLAAAGPARRAARTDPIEALRAE